MLYFESAAMDGRFWCTTKSKTSKLAKRKFEGAIMDDRINKPAP